ncbi:MAG TPA: hypothetical protein VLD19_00190 [Chitinophagaceae bacterium]|nr:hypothetical protein [Chitinophagaceae bacterium]
MNERQPYEQLIADKLQQLPVPDIDRSWQQMKRLLDENQSPGGGGGRKRFRPGGSGWWGAGIIAVVLITGVWVFMDHRSSPQEELASVKHAAAASAAPDSNKDAPGQKAAPDAGTPNSNHTNQNNNAPGQTSTLTDSPVSAEAASNTPGESDNNSSNSNKVHAGTTTAPGKDNAPASVSDNPAPSSTANAAAEFSKELPKKKQSSDKPGKTDRTAGSRYRRNIPVPGATDNKAGPAATDLAQKIPVNKPRSNDKASHPNTLAHRRNANPSNIPGHHNRSRDNKDKNPEVLSGQPYNNQPVATGRNAGAGKPTGPLNRALNNRPAAANDRAADEALLAKQRERRGHLQELKQATEPGTINSDLAAGRPVDARRDTSHLLNDKTKALIATSRKAEADAIAAKKAKKAVHLNLSLNPLTFKSDGDQWWGAGLAFNAAVPVGSQGRYKHNINGGSGLLTDYLPSPYVQFHLNRNVYFQTEINLSSPQYVPQLCLYQRSAPYSPGGPNGMNEKSIYIQKLYYFNWPVSLHYSPVNNLYLSTGLQFSSFQSGLALINERRFQSTGGPGTIDSFNSSLVKFKDDSIAAQLRPNEWRWQLGAEYYWNRFTLGMRYNKAFTDLASFGPPNGVPDSKIRNSAFLFFVRFNFFEGRKKDNTAQPAGSLVRY